MSTEPLFWYRPRTDGGYEGPIHNNQIEDVRKTSGAWVPLFSGSTPVISETVVTLNGAQLLQALDFIGPDRDTDPQQLECELIIAYGDGYAGKGYYCYLADCPEEGSILLDAEAPDAPAAPTSAEPVEMSTLFVAGSINRHLDTALDQSKVMAAARAIAQHFAAPVAAQAPVFSVGVRGVGIIDDNPSALAVYFNAAPNDDDIRALHEIVTNAPISAQPDITQQTLDDVKAGIPARDAEIDSLRKEIETLRDANKADAGQNYNDGFSDGVILALQLMSMHGDYGGTQYCELLSAAGPNQIVERAISEGMWEMSGLSQTPTAVERRAAIDTARKEQA